MVTRGHIELPEVGILRALEEREREKLSEFGHSLRVDSSTEVVQQGSRQDSLYVILDGRLSVAHRHKKDADAVVLGELEKGETFGEMSIIDPAKASASVTTLTDALLWRIRRTSLDDFILRNPDAGLRFLWEVSALLVKRLRHVNEDVATPDKKSHKWW